ncbi:MAG TPA: DAK2 domain-containing protein, partial [Anaerolineales bacterium]|nr:DAK2 domain-containing protein [Anaerolineales bacterium]
MRLPIDGQAAKALTAAGLAWLRTNQESVNSLNVFPVPDGDTGTNMVLTMQSAYNEVSGSAERNIGRMVHALAHGALMGARGNSGVILSQIWRGFARTLDGAELLDGPLIVQGLVEARETAYRGVVKPVEGTILTVARDIATAAEGALAETDHPVLILEKIVAEAEESVNRTPDLLPVLKKAGVVDAGGMGLFLIFDGMMRHINGASLHTPAASIRPLHEIQLEESLESIEPGQDYEVVVDFFPTNGRIGEEFFEMLVEMGTSIQIGEGEGMYRIHIHVPEEKRYEPIELALRVGTVTKVAIENLVAQMEALDRRNSTQKVELQPVSADEIAAVAVAPGRGLARLFGELGVAGIIEGGQTMNPNVKEILEVVENLPTDRVVILPNNKNIILAAEGAAGLSKKQIAVIPSRSIPQGIEAMLKFSPEGEFDAVVNRMNA